MCAEAGVGNVLIRPVNVLILMCVLQDIVAAVVVTLHPRSGDVVPVSFTSLAFEGFITIWGNWHVAAVSCLHSTARYRNWLASAAHRVLSIITILTVNIIIGALVPQVQAAVGGIILGEDDTAAGAGAPPPNTDVATFVLVRVTLSGALPLVSTLAITLLPAILFRTVTGGVTLGIGGAGGTVYGASSVTCL